MRFVTQISGILLYCARWSFDWLNAMSFVTISGSAPFTKISARQDYHQKNFLIYRGNILKVSEIPDYLWESMDKVAFPRYF